MKKTMQAIKVDVVDQEVAVINTLTSDQCTESDYQHDQQQFANFFHVNSLNQSILQESCNNNAGSSARNSDVYTVLRAATASNAIHIEESQQSKNFDSYNNDDQQKQFLNRHQQKRAQLELSKLDQNSPLALMKNGVKQHSLIASSRVEPLHRHELATNNSCIQENPEPQTARQVKHDQETPLLLQFKAMSDKNQVHAVGEAVSTNLQTARPQLSNRIGRNGAPFLSMQMPKELTDTSNPVHESTVQGAATEEDQVSNAHVSCTSCSTIRQQLLIDQPPASSQQKPSQLKTHGQSKNVLMMPVEEKDEQSFWQSNYNLCSCAPPDPELQYPRPSHLESSEVVASPGVEPEQKNAGSSDVVSAEANQNLRSAERLFQHHRPLQTIQQRLPNQMMQQHRQAAQELSAKKVQNGDKLMTQTNNMSLTSNTDANVKSSEIGDNSEGPDEQLTSGRSKGPNKKISSIHPGVTHHGAAATIQQPLKPTYNSQLQKKRALRKTHHNQPKTRKTIAAHNYTLAAQQALQVTTTLRGKEAQGSLKAATSTLQTPKPRLGRRQNQVLPLTSAHGKSSFVGSSSIISSGKPPPANQSAKTAGNGRKSMPFVCAVDLQSVQSSQSSRRDNLPRVLILPNQPPPQSLVSNKVSKQLQIIAQNKPAASQESFSLQLEKTVDVITISESGEDTQQQQAQQNVVVKKADSEMSAVIPGKLKERASISPKKNLRTPPKKIIQLHLLKQDSSCKPPPEEQEASQSAVTSQEPQIASNKPTLTNNTVNKLPESKVRVRSFTDRTVSKGCRPASAEQSSRLKRFQNVVNSGNKIELVQAIKPGTTTTTNTLAQSPVRTLKRTAMMLASPRPIKGYARQTASIEKLQRKTNIVAIDLRLAIESNAGTSSPPDRADYCTPFRARYDPQTVKHRYLPHVSNQLKVICFDQVAQHFSFRELTDLLQLCRHTRRSQTILRAQKRAYLNLLRKGQIEVQSNDAQRVRMWFQRLNISISAQSEELSFSKKAKAHLAQSQSKKTSPDANKNIEIIELDLIRSDFTMPETIVADTSAIKQSCQNVLQKLAENLPFGYLQGMNYVVIAIYRITNSFKMTYALVLKLFQNKKITRIFLDETAKPMLDACSQLNVFIAAYLPKLGRAMEKFGVETDYFAQRWFITMLFHFQIADQLRGRSKKQFSVENQRVMESIILDFICLDDAKSLIKVPLCALYALQINSAALCLKRNASTPGGFQRYSNYRVAYQNNLQRSRQNDVSRAILPQQSFHSQASCTEQSMTTQEEFDDDCEHLISIIKRSAAEYISGCTQLRSQAFKKEAKTSKGISTFYHKKDEETIKVRYLVRDFVDTYQAFKVNRKLYTSLKDAQQAAQLRKRERAMQQQNLTLADTQSGIIRPGYLTNIRQGAFDFGCHLFGIAASADNPENVEKDGAKYGSSHEPAVQKKISGNLDEHHLSFNEDDGAEENSKLSQKGTQSEMKTIGSNRQLLSHGSSLANLHSMHMKSRGGQFALSLRKMPSVAMQNISVSGTAGKNHNLTAYSESGQNLRAYGGRQKKIIQKQVQVTGDAESFEQMSVITKQSIRESIIHHNRNDSNKLRIILDSSERRVIDDDDDHHYQEGEVTKEDAPNHMKFEYSSVKKEPHNLLRTVTPGGNQDENMLPEVEDVHEQDDRTTIVKKIRISQIKASHASILSPNDQALNSSNNQSITPFLTNRKTGGTETGAEFKQVKLVCSPEKSVSSPKECQRAKPQCTFEKVPQQKNSQQQRPSTRNSGNQTASNSRTATASLFQRNSSSRELQSSLSQRKAVGMILESYHPRTAKTITNKNIMSEKLSGDAGNLKKHRGYEKSEFSQSQYSSVHSARAEDVAKTGSLSLKKEASEADEYQRNKSSLVQDVEVDDDDDDSIGVETILIHTKPSMQSHSQSNLQSISQVLYNEKGSAQEASQDHKGSTSQLSSQDQQPFQPAMAELRSNSDENKTLPTEYGSVLDSVAQPNHQTSQVIITTTAPQKQQKMFRRKNQQIYSQVSFTGCSLTKKTKSSSKQTFSLASTNAKTAASIRFRQQDEGSAGGGKNSAQSTSNGMSSSLQSASLVSQQAYIANAARNAVFSQLSQTSSLTSRQFYLNSQSSQQATTVPMTRSDLQLQTQQNLAMMLNFKDINQSSSLASGSQKGFSPQSSQRPSNQLIGVPLKRCISKKKFS